MNKIDRTIIKPFEEVELKVYAYTLPTVPTHEGCVKVGETSREVEQRLREQLQTIGIKHNLLFEKLAKHSDGNWFHDKDLHRFFILNNIEKVDFETGADEWFYFNDKPHRAEELTDKFIRKDYSDIGHKDNHYDYILRDEQKSAVQETLSYYKNPNYGTEFLWNAKPRFGKTLTTYDFIRKIDAKKVLIVTNRPAIANSWFDDFNKFIGWQEEHIKFISETDALKKCAMNRNEYIDFAKSYIENNEDINPGYIAFVSLQDLKGAKFAGGQYDKLEWIRDESWDILVIDEAHEGVDTSKTDKAFSKIRRNFTLHLSGTPFKAIANSKFHTDQIYNWSYADEQLAKKTWNESFGTNPYENLPTLNLFTYQMSKIIEDTVREGSKINEEETVDYAFDLNEFFRTDDNGKFIYESSVKQFLDNLTTGKFPFAESEYRHKLNHTLWLLSRVASAKALEKLLKKHPVFSSYEIVLAAGDGQSLEDDLEELLGKTTDARSNEKSYDKVKKAIKNNEKTITLSVGQLTTGVTIPEWTGVMILSNIQSPEFYFQAAFRAQNPYEFKDDTTGMLIQKENAYVFDFAPERTLLLYDEFANNLSSYSVKAGVDERKDKIIELLNFFPVIAEDEKGTMHELNAEEVLTIPKQIKATEVVKRGFMSNLLFANISAIFLAPTQFKQILDKIQPEKNKRLQKKRDVNITNPMIDNNRDINIPKNIVISKTEELFGKAIIKDRDRIAELVNNLENTNEKVSEVVNTHVDVVVDELSRGLGSFREEFKLNKGQMDRVIIELKKDIGNKLEEELDKNFEELERIEEEYKEKLEETSTEESEKIIIEYNEKKEKIKEIYTDTVLKNVEEIIKENIENQIEKQEGIKKKTSEDDVRDHLRGFARTIPAFLMAYGDKDTKLSNFDEVVDEKTFEELTSITLDEFRSLRDGLIIIDEEGNEEVVPGLFDEIVFNESIQEFFRVKERLSDYINTQETEDIFDYIPNQKTNQIFTPRPVVKMMVDLLEKENSEIFRNKNIKFIDLYTKSGLYLTEIVKKLDKGLESQIPDRKDRIKWILENQVYACAPSNIIYNIVKNYVFGEFEGVDTSNIIELDLVEYAQKGKIEEEIKEKWGEEMKFDVIIGNPPYQEETEGTSDNPIYHLFMEEAYKISDKVCLITPARFLFNAGKTPKEFNKKMLSDPHLKVLFYTQNSYEIFPDTDIKGGIAITFRNSKEEYRKIGTFTVYDELNSILKKVINKNFVSFNTLIYSSDSYKLGKKLHEDFPQAEKDLSFGHKYDVTTNIFEKLYYVFNDDLAGNLIDNIRMYGRLSNKRVYKRLRRVYIDNHPNLDKYKVFVPKSNGSGVLGEVLSSPVIGEPSVGHTQTFISIGSFEFKFEAEAVLKYIKTKFARTLLSTLKITQHNPAATWANVPLQDFTLDSDIDWNESIHEIDKQLYKKYNLSEEEIEFIEKNVKAME